MSFFAALPIVGKEVSQIVGVIDQAVEDKDQAAKLKQEVRMALIQQDFSFVEEELKARARIIFTEAQGASFPQRNWRPILMLTFTYIVAHKYVFLPLHVRQP